MKIGGGILLNNGVKVKNSAYLFLTALIWGVAFVFQTMGNDYMQPFTFNSARNFLGFLVLIPLVIFRLKKPSLSSGSEKGGQTKIPWKLTITGGVLCGLALATASMFQQYGMKYTTVGKAGFITALYIIITPIFGLFLKKKCPFTVWIGAAASVVGMYLLCVSERLTLSIGDLLILICAVFFSAQILLIDYFSPKTDGVLLSCIEFLTGAVICGVFAIFLEAPTLNQLIDGAVPVLYTGIMSSGVAYTLQILGQRNFNPTIAAMIMSLESVISAVASFIAYRLGFLKTDQSMTAVQIIGCVIMFTAVIFVQLPTDKLFRKKIK